MCSRITSLDFIIIYCNICCVQDFGYYPKQLPKTAFSMWYLLETDDNVIFAGDSYVNVIFNQDWYLNFCDIHWRQMSMWYLLKYQCDIYW